MSRSERRKGVDGEAEVRRLLEAGGFTLRGLEGGGDWLAFGHGITLGVETKRQEVARPWAWYEQAVADVPPGIPPLVAFRRSRSPWLALIRLEDLVAAIAGAESYGRDHGGLRDAARAGDGFERATVISP